VESGTERFIMAEVPGLIEGAHLGKGLGHEFLQHIHRTRILIHIISGTSLTPLEDMVRVNQELNLYDPALSQKTQIVVINKVDLLEVRKRMNEIKNDFIESGIKAYYISASTGEGVIELMSAVMNNLKSETEKVTKQETGRKVFHPRPKDTRVKVEKKGENFILKVPELERLYAGPGASPSELRWQMHRQLTRRGLIKDLEKAGVRPGSKIRCGDIEWEW
jgi:GTP-binding protein